MKISSTRDKEKKMKRFLTIIAAVSAISLAACSSSSSDSESNTEETKAPSSTESNGAGEAAISTDSNDGTKDTNTTDSSKESDAPSYYIIFDANDGSGGKKRQTFLLEEKKALTSNPFSRTGYTFSGWNTVIDGSGESYDDKAIVANLAKNGETATLFAQWKPISYKVVFMPNDGDGTPVTQEFSYDEEKPLSANDFRNTGKSFLVWNTEKNGKGTGYLNKEIVKNLSSTNGEKITLYAQWEQNGKRRIFITDNDLSSLDNIQNRVNYNYHIYCAAPLTKEMISKISKCVKENSNCRFTLSFGKGSAITEIPDNAFDGCSNLTITAIPSGITVIGRNAFHNCHFENLSIPDTVVEIKSRAFSFCSFGTVSIPGSVSVIEPYTFTGLTASHVIMQEGIKHIGDYAFYRWDMSFVLSIPASVNRIGKKAFYKDSETYLEKIKIADTNARWCHTENDNYEGGSVSFTLSADKIKSYSDHYLYKKE